jgi:2-keto-4-pentenoate hydratase/2-oxohepta-3-ene-1,7-dioic acid hydratase in catechol pathway
MRRTALLVPLAVTAIVGASLGSRESSASAIDAGPLELRPGNWELSQQGAVTRYVRYSHRDRISYGILDGESIRELRGDLFASPQPTGVTVRRSEVRLLAPLDPARVSKVVGVAINTRRPGLEAPVPHPRWFAKFPSSLNDPDGDVEMPPEATNLNYEGELVVVIGKRARHVSEADALSHVFGYTVGNDFSENTWYGERQGVNEPTRLLSKGMDSWAPIGPAIVTGIEHRGLPVRTRLNGELVQDGTTNDLVNDVPKLISHLSRYVTLLPGDVIFTGTVRVLPDKRRRMQPGDVVEVEIEGLGTIRNRIVEMKER